MEEKISQSIIRSFFNKLEDSLSLDVAIVGAGPSGMIAAKELALAGKKVAIFESKLAPGGGVWGGGMLLISLAGKKADVTLDTPTGEVMGEKPMWMENGMGGLRMGPVFGGMFLSGKKAARLILEDID